MKKDPYHKMLVLISENSIFYKLKMFFYRFFHKNTESIHHSMKSTIFNRNEQIENSFIDSLKNIKDDNSILLNLQQQYRTGNLKVEELTLEQISSLCQLYDTQITALKQSNFVRKQKLLNYRNNM